MALVALAMAFVRRRASQLFVLSVRDGRLLVLQGALPISLRQELGDVLKRPPTVSRATVRAVEGRRGLSLEVSGLDEGRAQRLRNVFYTFPAARLRSASPEPGRNLGQLLGIPALAWYLTDSRYRSE